MNESLSAGENIPSAPVFTEVETDRRISNSSRKIVDTLVAAIKEHRTQSSLEQALLLSTNERARIMHSLFTVTNGKESGIVTLRENMWDSYKDATGSALSTNDELISYAIEYYIHTCLLRDLVGRHDLTNKNLRKDMPDMPQVEETTMHEVYISVMSKLEKQGLVEGTEIDN